MTIRLIGIAATKSVDLAGKAMPPIQERKFGWKQDIWGAVAPSLSNVSKAKAVKALSMSDPYK